MKKQNQQTIFCKEDFKWHYISFYLDSLLGSVPIDDEEFLKLFKAVQDYVEKKVFTKIAGDPVDMYVIIERKV
ncbi:MAG: hypothetical protein NC037_00425 [Bacteroides sp.]|nr:hypothetical protein [Bacillota bacterium]MCM1393636.1 hypothetical protein [[Eubacterium] siraeum]MCM1454982.1 hypothetical protein [Bacteroides sp.]